jgi:hypothetical protein
LGGGRRFGSTSLRINDRIFAMIASKGRFVVKLPARRVEEIIAAGDGEHFDSAGRRWMKEWVSMAPRTEARAAPGAAKAAGVRFGEDAARQGARSVVEALTPLDALGADYSLEGERILAGNCIFFEACDQAREVICAAQAGILEGALCAAGIDATVVPEGPLPTRGCAYRLTRRGTAT